MKFTPAAADELYTEIRRHVGHGLRCVRERNDVAGYVVEAVALRCDDCGEVILEGTLRLLKRSRKAR
jgi:hypothetical protein